MLFMSNTYALSHGLVHLPVYSVCTLFQAFWLCHTGSLESYLWRPDIMWGWCSLGNILLKLCTCLFQQSVALEERDLFGEIIKPVNKLNRHDNRKYASFSDSPRKMVRSQFIFTVKHNIQLTYTQQCSTNVCHTTPLCKRKEMALFNLAFSLAGDARPPLVGEGVSCFQAPPLYYQPAGWQKGITPQNRE